MVNWNLSRRQFLKVSAVTGALMASGSYLSMGDWIKSAEGETVDGIKRIPSLCNGCSSKCGIVVSVKNGRVFRVDGNPDHPYSKGKLCAKAHGVATLAYHPSRITQPMKKVAEGKFEPISWEQATKEIGAKLKTIIDKNGPGSLVYLEDPKPAGEVYGQRLTKALGSKNLFSHHTACSLSRDTAFGWVLGGVPSADISNTKMVIFIGRSYGDGIRPSSVQSLVSARKKGTKIVIIDPRLNNTSPLADQWIPIKAGSDLALLLAMANVIISEKLYDEPFVTQNGLGFEAFAEGMKSYTPEWASEKTDIPADTIRQLAIDFAKARPRAVIEQSWKGAFGCNYENSTETARMVALVNALIGNINAKGGYYFGKKPKIGEMEHVPTPKPTGERLDGAGVKGAKFYLCATSKGVTQMVPDLVKEGKVKAAIIHHYNPVRNIPDPQVMLDGFKQLELSVVYDIWMSETAEIADYVLPDTSYLERTEPVHEVSGKRGTITLRQQAVEKIHPETKPFAEFVSELANEMGIGQYFFDVDEYNQTAIAPLGITYDELKQKGAIQVGEEWQEGFTKLKTKSGKVEFACPAFKEAGFTEVPTWIPPRVEIKENEFRLIHGKQNTHAHSSTVHIPLLSQISKDYDLDRLWINASRAKKLGIKDGDWIIIESAKHSGRTKAKVTEGIHPEAVFYPCHYGSFASGLPNKGYGLSVCDFVEHQFEAMSGASNMMEVAVTVRKDGV